MSKLKLISIILFSLIMVSCATVVSLDDYDESYSYISYDENEVIGKVRVSSVDFVGKNYRKNDNKTLALTSRLEKKAVEKYGTNIELRDVEIGKFSKSYIPEVAISLAGMTLGSYLISETTNDKFADFLAGVNSMFVFMPLFRLSHATAVVLKSDSKFNGIHNRENRDEIEQLRNEYKELQIKKERQNKISEQLKERQNLLNSIANQLLDSGYSEQQVQSVREGFVFIGMPEEYIKIILGEADYINTTITEFGKSKKYSYSKGLTIYSDDGKVTIIQY